MHGMQVTQSCLEFQQVYRRKTATHVNILRQQRYTMCHGRKATNDHERHRVPHQALKQRFKFCHIASSLPGAASPRLPAPDCALGFARRVSCEDCSRPATCHSHPSPRLSTLPIRYSWMGSASCQDVSRRHDQSEPFAGAPLKGLFPSFAHTLCSPGDSSPAPARAGRRRARRSRNADAAASPRHV